MTDPVRWPPERLAEIREAEMAACLAVLGVTEHHWLGYPDGGCAAVGLDAGAGGGGGAAARRSGRTRC